MIVLVFQSFLAVNAWIGCFHCVKLVLDQLSILVLTVAFSATASVTVVSIWVLMDYLNGD